MGSSASVVGSAVSGRAHPGSTDPARRRLEESSRRVSVVWPVAHFCSFSSLRMSDPPEGQPPCPLTAAPRCCVPIRAWPSAGRARGPVFIGAALRGSGTLGGAAPCWAPSWACGAGLAVHVQWQFSVKAGEDVASRDRQVVW